MSSGRGSRPGFRCAAPGSSPGRRAGPGSRKPSVCRSLSRGAAARRTAVRRPRERAARPAPAPRACRRRRRCPGRAPRPRCRGGPRARSVRGCVCTPGDQWRSVPGSRDGPGSPRATPPSPRCAGSSRRHRRGTPRRSRRVRGCATRRGLSPPAWRRALESWGPCPIRTGLPAESTRGSPPRPRARWRWRPGPGARSRSLSPTLPPIADESDRGGRTPWARCA